MRQNCFKIDNWFYKETAIGIPVNKNILINKLEVETKEKLGFDMVNKLS